LKRPVRPTGSEEKIQNCIVPRTVIPDISLKQVVMTEERKDMLAIMAAGLAVLNFLIFMAIASYLGGDALAGKVEDGHYFVASHGHYTEVSQAVYIYSKIHTLSMFVTHALAFITALMPSRDAARSKSRDRVM
jgi:hypothetical protein